MPIKKRPYNIGGYSVHQYVFTPDAELGAVITTGDAQGSIYVSGPVPEIVKRIFSVCEVAPLTTAATWQIEYYSDEDMDTVGSWTEIESFTHTAAHLSVASTSGFTNEVIPARRAIRFNVDAVGGTAAQNVTVTMEVHRPIQ